MPTGKGSLPFPKDLAQQAELAEQFIHADLAGVLSRELALTLAEVALSYAKGHPPEPPADLGSIDERIKRTYKLGAYEDSKGYVWKLNGDGWRTYKMGRGNVLVYRQHFNEFLKREFDTAADWDDTDHLNDRSYYD